MSGLSKTKCAECGDSSRARGRTSPYFCAPCDEERVNRISASFERILKNWPKKEQV